MSEVEILRQALVAIRKVASEQRKHGTEYAWACGTISSMASQKLAEAEAARQAGKA